MGLTNRRIPILGDLKKLKLCNSRGILLSLLMLLSTVSVQGTKTRCNSTTVQLGKTATLTCEFHEDMSRIQKNIYVDHRESTRVEDHELVVACQWSSGKLNCRSIFGYEVNGTVTDRLTFTIQETLQKHSGEYLCGVLESPSYEHESCVLTVIESTQLSAAITTHIPQSNKREFERGRSDKETNSFTIIIVLSALVGALTIALTTLLVLLCVRLKGKPEQKQRFPNSTNYASCETALQRTNNSV